MGRGNNFDFIRLVMACLVIYSHAYPLCGRPEPKPLGATFGGLAVYSFFVISGFLITMSWDRGKGALDYLSKRARRIAPGYVVAMLVSALVVTPLVAPAFAPEWKRLLKHILLISNWQTRQAFADNPFPYIVNGSLWTIRYEVHCYVLVALLGLAGLLRPLVVTALTAGVYLYANLKGPTASHWLTHAPTLGVYYLVGMLAYLYRDRLRFSPWLAVVALAGFLAPVFHPRLSLILWPVALSYLLLWLAFTPRVRLHGFAAAVGGDYSYGVYLYAFPIQQLLVYWRPGMHPLTNFALALPLSLIAGAVSWHGLERWFLRKSRVVKTEEAASPSSSAPSVQRIADPLPPSPSPSRS